MLTYRQVKVETANVFPAGVHFLSSNGMVLPLRRKNNML